MTTRAIVTFATGAYRELLDIALPTFRDFATRHGYQVRVANPPPAGRRESWLKVPAIAKALNTYDEVLYLDADVVIVDPSADLDVPDGYWHALVEHHTADGQVPNCGVWLLRKPMLPVLEQVWKLDGYLDHPWWEQAALVDLMGYRGRPLTPPVRPPELYERTWLLENGWNVHRHDRTHVGHARVRHATMWPDRAAVMREWAAESMVPA